MSKIKRLVSSREDDGSMPELRAFRSEPSIEAIVSAAARSHR